MIESIQERKEGSNETFEKEMEIKREGEGEKKREAIMDGRIGRLQRV